MELLESVDEIVRAAICSNTVAKDTAAEEVSQALQAKGSGRAAATETELGWETEESAAASETPCQYNLDSEVSAKKQAMFPSSSRLPS